MNSQQPNFFDRKTLSAVVIVFAIFWLWQTYMTQKYPNLYSKKENATPVTQPADPAKVQAPPAAAPTVQTAAPPTTVSEMALPEKETFVRFENAEVSFDISSHGMGLKNYELKNFKDRKGQVINYGAISVLETRLMGRREPLNFKIEKLNENQFVGRARIGSMEVVKTMEMGPTPYSIQYKVAVNNPDDRFVGLSTVLPEDPMEEPPSGFTLIAPVDHEEMFIRNNETHERIHFGKDDIEKSWTKVQMASVGSQYFTQAIVDRSNIMPEAKGTLKRSNNLAEIVLNYALINKGNSFDLSYVAFVGPKAFDLLKQTDENLSQVIDFGFFNWIARQILKMLKYFYALLGNWGLAIIALTIVVRILVLPFNVISYKSTRAMQAIQPQMKAIKEKYKNDTQKQQLETMALMREHKVNPMGGCLPVLLQFPIFIALYQVLGHSIELYQAPFGLWIHDLSLKDPFYVLPVLMGATMFLQQKIMPTPGMDPTQANILKFMPLMFALFMISVPSGLTLYIFVSSAFAVLQQIYFMKTHEPKTVPQT